MSVGGRGGGGHEQQFRCQPGSRVAALNPQDTTRRTVLTDTVASLVDMPRFVAVWGPEIPSWTPPDGVSSFLVPKEESPPSGCAPVKISGPHTATRLQARRACRARTYYSAMSDKYFEVYSDAYYDEMTP